MTEPVEFEVPDAGEPALGDAAQPPSDIKLLAPIPGWTPDEAAQVVGGMVANVTIVLYAVKWKAPPPMELAPAIAGNPALEFPLLGAGLAPMLDLIAPKGSPQATGVSLAAGVGELVSAIARRSAVLNVPPKQDRPPVGAPAAAAAPQQPATAAPAPDGGFRFNRDQLTVLARAQNPYADLGME